MFRNSLAVSALNGFHIIMTISVVEKAICDELDKSDNRQYFSRPTAFLTKNGIQWTRAMNFHNYLTKMFWLRLLVYRMNKTILVNFLDTVYYAIGIHGPWLKYPKYWSYLV